MEQGVRGKTVLITGATSGIGLETARALASQGAVVWLGCRNLEKAHAVARDIKLQQPTAAVVIPATPLDLGNTGSIRAFAKAFIGERDHLDILVNSAGANYTNPWKTAEGVTGLVQVNYLGAYLLTRLLEPVLPMGSRVINVTSVTHRIAHFDEPAAFLGQRNRGATHLYPETKLANVLFTYELQRRMYRRGLQVAAVDPGSVASNIWRRQGALSKGLIRAAIDNLYAPPWDGASAVVHACGCKMPTTPYRSNQNGGSPPAETFPTPCLYYARGLFTSPLITRLGPRKGWFGELAFYAWAGSALIHSFLDWPIRHLTGGVLASRTTLVPSSPLSYDALLARRLWQESAKVVGLSDRTEGWPAERAVKTNGNINALKKQA